MLPFKVVYVGANPLNSHVEADIYALSIQYDLPM